MYILRDVPFFVSVSVMETDLKLVDKKLNRLLMTENNFILWGHRKSKESNIMATLMSELQKILTTKAQIQHSKYKILNINAC